jgi:tetratricopeptide (TPR) repeat protein
LTIPFLSATVIAWWLKAKGAGKAPPKVPLRRLIWGSALASPMVAFVFQVTDLPDVIVPLWPVPGNSYWFLSTAHLMDIANLCLLLAPLGAGVWLLFRFRGSRNRTISSAEQLLITVSLWTFLVSFWVNPTLGAPRDWDLLSFFGFPLSLWGIYSLCLASTSKLWLYRCLISAFVVVFVTAVPNLLEKNDLDKAAMRLDDILWKDAHYQDDYYQAARCLSWAHILWENAEDQEGAMKYYRRLVNAQPTSYKVWSTLGERHFIRGNRDSAYVHLRRAMALEANDAYLLSLMGTVEVTLGRNDDALAHFRKAYTIEPASRKHSIQLGMFHGLRDAHDSAFHYLKQGLSLPEGDSEKPIVYRSLFNSALAVGQFAVADRALQELARRGIDPSELSQMRLLLQEAIHSSGTKP